MCVDGYRVVCWSILPYWSGRECVCVCVQGGALLSLGRKSQSESSSCLQPMAVVASTILGLIQNLRAFGGILVVSPGALVVSWVSWLYGV